MGMEYLQWECIEHTMGIEHVSWKYCKLEYMDGIECSLLIPSSNHTTLIWLYHTAL